MSAAARNSQDIGNLYSAAMVPAAIDQMVDAMEALDDDKLPAEDRIENAKKNATKTLKNLADQAQWRAQEGNGSS